jgi:hypothetical protein
MTEQTAEKLATVILAAAVGGAAVIVLRTPALRRLAWGLAVTAFTRSLPAWVAGEVRHAWAHSAPAVGPGSRRGI